jgi:integrase
MAKSGEPPEAWDQILRGFGARARVGGATFFAMRRVRGAGRPQAARITVGEYGPLTLAEARERARLILRDLQDGIDPRERKAEQLRTEMAKQSNSFAAVAEEFICRHVVKARTARDIELRIRRELVARWGGRPIAAIARADVIKVVELVVDSGRPEAARATFSTADRLFGWALGRDYGLLLNPCKGVSIRDLVGAKQIRQRVLSDIELAVIWRAAGEGVEGSFVRLLILLGQRRRETSGAVWGEIDLDRARWVIPATRMKEDEAHVVLLPAAAIELLQSLPRFATDFVLSTTGKRALNDFSGTKERLDARATELNGNIALEPWTFHDLRRSFRTGLSTLGIRPDIAEMCIAHRQSGLARTYDMHRFEAEKRHAFEAWAAHIARILDPPSGVVVPMSRRP